MVNTCIDNGTLLEYINLVINHDILLQCSLIPRLSQATGGGGSVWNQYASITVLFLYREARL